MFSVFTLELSKDIICENVKIDLRQLTDYLMFEENLIDLVSAELQIAITKPSKTNFNRTHIFKHTQTQTHTLTQAHTRTHTHIHKMF